MPSRRGFLALAFLLALAGVAFAQGPMLAPAERESFMREAFASTYGKANIAELGRALRRDADPACLAAKDLQASQLEPRGGDLLIKWSIVKWSIVFSERHGALYDAKVYSELFTASSELEELKQTAEVKRYLAISAPASQANMIDVLTENFSRYMLMNRIKLRFMSAAETGNPELKSKDPTEATEKALEKFVTESKSATLERFLDLSEQAIAAMNASIDTERAKKIMPHTFLNGIETDLAELCIGTR